MKSFVYKIYRLEDFIYFERIFLKSIDFLVESNGHISSDPENNMKIF